MKPVAIVLYCMYERNSDMPQAKKVSAPKPASILERSDSGVRDLLRRRAVARRDVHEQRPHRRAVPERLVERRAERDDDGGAAHERRVLQVHAEEHDALHHERQLGDEPEGDLGERQLVGQRLRRAVGGERARIVAQRLIGGLRRERGVEVASIGAARARR